MSGMTQSVDIDVNITSADGDLPFSSGLNVVDAEIQRVFGGAGSKAEVSVIFEDRLGLEEEKSLREVIDQGVVSSARRPHIPDSVYDMDDHFAGLSPADRRGQEATITIDVEVENVTESGISKRGSRLYTGTVIKVEQSDDRVVTFYALDRRHDFNRYMVKLDTTSEPQPTTTVLRNILGKKDDLGRGMQLTEGEDFIIDLTNDPKLIKDSWGIEGHATVWEVLLDLSRVEGATMYIDGSNTFYFTDWPKHTLWTSKRLSPIVEWSGSSNENSTEVLVESPYDGTGLGLYAPISGERQESRINNSDNLGREITENNVFTRRALENVRSWEKITTALMKDSGKIKVVGDPLIHPYDEVRLDENTIDGFSPIAGGRYTAKRVYHKISSENGYITELHLGHDTEELFEKFANKDVIENSRGGTTTGEQGLFEKAKDAFAELRELPYELP